MLKMSLSIYGKLSKYNKINYALIQSNLVILNAHGKQNWIDIAGDCHIQTVYQGKSNQREMKNSST